ncbi:MAG: PD-(D/E)XK nuclease family protein [Clostridiales bacterium]|nr:PD-(D/E)XK nuclease family protein [Clostridiales bacterium]
MNEQQERALKEFLLDIDCLKRLDEWTDNFNLFDVLKITHTEIRHSNILSWLLDPNENHKLGDSFIREFVSAILKNSKISDDLALDLLMQNFYSYNVLREHNHMDLVLLSREEETAYVIENKIWSGESQHQLKDYYKKSQEEYVGYKIIYAFLTPDGHEASDPKTWIPISYDDIIPPLEEIIKDANVSSEVKILVNNYISATRKEIMREKPDERLVSICNEIYNKHREALDLIFQNVNVKKSFESEVICNVLRDYSNDGKLVYLNDSSWNFFTERMTTLLPDLEEENGSWGTKYVYYYWFEQYNDKLLIHLELGGNGIPDDSATFKNILSLMECSKSIGNRVNSVVPFKYKRIFTKILTIDEADENSLEKQAKKLIDLALENEDKLFEKLKENNLSVNS